MILSPVIKTFTLLCLAAGIFSQQYEGDSCKTNEGTDGVCRNIQQCQTAIDEVNKGNIPSICGFVDRVPIVCCPNPRPPATRPTVSPTRPTPRPTAPSGQSKSKQKCIEYSSLVFSKSGVTVLLPNSDSTKESQCVDGRPFIINGTKAEPKEFPHMAAIGYGNKNAITWACGGSLISNKFIVTAAHCLSSRDWGLAKWIRLGDLNIRRTDDEVKTQEFGVANMHRHPGYSSPAHYNDIALIELDREVKFDGYVRPACLHVDDNVPAEQPSAIGWGLTDWIGSKGSDDLLKVKLSFQDTTLCNETFSPMIGGRKLRNGITPETMLCVGDLAGGKDTCKGDSGGPLQIRMEDPYCMYDILGITSFGSICGSKNAPAVYTRVSYFVPWIESIVWS